MNPNPARITLRPWQESDAEALFKYASDPDIEASAERLKLVNNITKMDKESFVGAFEEWYEKYKDIVNERVQDKRIKHKTPPYMRPRLRSAYLSVRRNMPLLWTFYDPRHRL